MRVAFLILASFLSGLCNAQRRVFTPNGYLPPIPDDEMCLPTTKTEYRTSTTREIATNFVEGPGGVVITSTYVTEKVVPTTVYQTDVRTRVSTYSQIATQTQRSDVLSTFITTIGGVPVTTTVSSTITIPERIVSTFYETTQDLKRVTSTYVDQEVTTVVRAVTSTDVRERYVTQTVPLRGPDDTRTTVATSRIVSTIVSQPPPITTVQTQTSASVIVTTTRVQLPGEVITRATTIPQYDYTTQIKTLSDFVTSTQRVTITSTGVSTIRNTQIQTVLSTNVVRQSTQVVVTSARVTTQYQPTTVYGTDVVTRTDSQPPIYVTSTVERYVTVTGEGGLQVVTNTIYSTTLVQITSTITQGVQETITTTRTIKESPCGKTGYNYQPPSTPFEFSS